MACSERVEKKSFKETLNLPRTDFPIRPQASLDDPAMIERWEREQLYATTYTHNQGHETFVLHDGPPYANGHIHIGHAYNKVLKDIVTKSQRMMGKHVPVKPGWDCHGLPIEKKVTDEQPTLTALALKKACRAYAQRWVNIQRQEFKNLAVFMNWDHSYETMSPEYEAAILRAFAVFIADGYIERKNKTVPWCASCKTVLALAEIEYEERKDPSLYVLFQLDPTFSNQLFPTHTDKPVDFLVWTTTPWTLPLNRAVLLRPGTVYALLDTPDSYVIVAKESAAALAALLSLPLTIVAEFLSDELIAIGPRALHPFIEGLKVPVLTDISVEVGEGTACVHSAPGCGPQDYEVGVKNNLEIFSPLTVDGSYSYGIQPEELEGMSVVDGQIWVIKKLAENKRLLHKTSIKHSYPHCWRCHKGLIFRATRQWFCDLEKGDLKRRVLTAIESIVTIPEKSINRLKTTIEGRLEWCLSRQRTWGVPIPALLCTKCDYVYCTPGLINRVADHVAQEGIEFWDTVEVDALLPKGFTCPLCLNASFKKETDILDVWFESGVSHYAVLYKNPELAYPADMYLEGSDQHRAWFQSSLLTALVLERSAPMKLIFTHGFVVDGQGRKMSKSLGNVVAPQDIINQVGVDGLRLWVSSLDCSGDAVVSETLIKNVAQVFGKIRNTCRFLLSNLYDFDQEKDAIPYDNLMAIDQYACTQLRELNEKVIQQYADMDFTAIFHTLGDYCAVDLSAFYLDIIKDRLYVEQADGHKRRAAQTACWYILDTLTRLIAPILSITAEQISDLYQKDKTSSIHLQNFALLKNVVTTTDSALWEILKEMRSAVHKAIEGLREKGTVKLSLEARLTLHLSPELYAQLQPIIHSDIEAVQFFKEFFIVSQVEIVPAHDGLETMSVKGFYLKAEHAQGSKCPRCWQWVEQPFTADGLCKRCADIVG